jgi:LacI family transcriptional regulator
MKEKAKVLLLIETSREYGRELLRGITKYAFLHGPWTLEQEAPFYIRTSKAVRLGVDPTKWDIDGVIMRDKKFAKKVLDFGIPVIFANHYKNYASQAPCIVTDDKAIGKKGAEHFLEKGFKNFAYINFQSKWSEL